MIPVPTGPHALGNRSILAAPFTEETTVRLNRTNAAVITGALRQRAGREH
ncbi:hypothetical protein [Streptomyces jumonjinensis]|nr:hypothetical protein [Streptomyces jumonjinensis]